MGLSRAQGISGIRDLLASACYAMRCFKSRQHPDSRFKFEQVEHIQGTTGKAFPRLGYSLLRSLQLRPGLFRSSEDLGVAEGGCATLKSEMRRLERRPAS